MKLLKSIWRFLFPVAKEVARDIVHYKAKLIWQNRSFRKRQLIGKLLGGWRVTEFISSKQTQKALSKKSRNSFTYKLESWQTVRISA